MDGEKVFSINILAAVVITAFVLVALNLLDPVLSLVAAGAAIAAVILAREPVYGLLMVIVIAPFAGTEILNMQLLGIPGLKLFNLLAAAVLFFFVVYKKPMPVELRDKQFIYGLILLFTIAVIRSTTFIQKSYNMIWTDEYSVSKFFLSYLVKPLLVFLPFILMVYYIRNAKDIRKIINCLVVSVIALSLFILYLYFFDTPDKSNFEAVRMGFGAVLGLHGNNLADFYIATYPLILAYTFAKKNLLLITALVLSLVTVGILYSRSAYAVVIVCTALFFLVSRRAVWIPAISAAVFMGYSLIPQSIVQRALTGLDSTNLNDVSAGRTSDIWAPLLNEYLGQPLKMIFGSGRYGIMSTDAFIDGVILRVNHAHSMYLDMIMDSGIIGLAFFLIFFALIFYGFVKSHPQIKDRNFLHIMYGVEISMVAFMFRGISDSFFFPALTNTYLWIVMAIGLSITYMYKNKDGLQEAQVSNIFSTPNR